MSIFTELGKYAVEIYDPTRGDLWDFFTIAERVLYLALIAVVVLGLIIYIAEDGRQQSEAD
tara:strand:+ start:2007 stop:2189 length:183 start_codon:yes stop_codon:yes gene_type:complete